MEQLDITTIRKEAIAAAKRKVKLELKKPVFDQGDTDVNSVAHDIVQKKLWEYLCDPEGEESEGYCEWLNETVDQVIAGDYDGLILEDLQEEIDNIIADSEGLSGL